MSYKRGPYGAMVVGLLWIPCVQPIGLIVVVIGILGVLLKAIV
jgi:hypothetical protein